MIFDAILMSSNQDETAVHGCHYPGAMVVRMRKELAIPRGWCSVLSCSNTVFRTFAAHTKPKMGEYHSLFASF